jgi:putative transposase
MTKGLHRYYGTNDLHFITCSCYHRQAQLRTPKRRNRFLRILEEARQKYRFSANLSIVASSPLIRKEPE